ncbi:hypothetical protein [Clostridium sp. BJN0013]
MKNTYKYRFRGREGMLPVSCAGGCSAKTNISVMWNNIDNMDNIFDAYAI